MLDPSNRFATIVLAAGSAVLLIAIAVGERMGDRVLGQATQQQLQSVAVAASAAPTQSAGPYGPDWKRSEALSAAGDPHFPDPRVPPLPLPTPLPTPKVTPTPYVAPTPTINPNLPVWRQKPLPTATPLPSESPTAEPTVPGPPSPPPRKQPGDISPRF
ncbi:MAG: hypothetical protein JOY69_07025 [Candidatus Eremiobacteraeota bacterium]|nr:hypothetical protein [Candidatus Eremiobacteraeota bacterium]MBV8372997.1 hypothetical protein [Candidatus Eremiobacteraeota bacterium]